ncbi:MAG: hypothetical protein ACK5QX_07650 [bacterium]|jgi:hypothetical protein
MLETGGLPRSFPDNGKQALNKNASNPSDEASQVCCDQDLRIGVSLSPRLKFKSGLSHNLAGVATGSITTNHLAFHLIIDL